ncbi:MAG TPA: hypothetical protein VHR86_06890 [Armatimonadota bacterium]|nr:hypothetical protein [Armatimonadota bacterium]
MRPRQIVWEHPAAKEFDHLPWYVQESVHTALARFAAYGLGDVRALEGMHGPEYRLRVGEYRVRFALPSGSNILLVLHVRARGSAYKM